MGFFDSIKAAFAKLFGKKNTGSDWRGFNAIKTTKVDTPEEFRRINDV